MLIISQRNHIWKQIPWRKCGILNSSIIFIFLSTYILHRWLTPNSIENKKRKRISKHRRETFKFQIMEDT